MSTGTRVDALVKSRHHFSYCKCLEILKKNSNYMRFIYARRNAYFVGPYGRRLPVCTAHTNTWQPAVTQTHEPDEVRSGCVTVNLGGTPDPDNNAPNDGAHCKICLIWIRWPLHMQCSCSCSRFRSLRFGVIVIIGIMRTRLCTKVMVIVAVTAMHARHEPKHRGEEKKTKF